jgi:hypothetical protein
MKAYLIITGAIFGILALMHFLHTPWDHLSDVGTILHGPGLGVVALGLCLWAGRLFWTVVRRS